MFRYRRKIIEENIILEEGKIPFPKEKDYPEEEKDNTLFDLDSDNNIIGTVIKNNNCSEEEEDL